MRMTGRPRLVAALPVVVTVERSWLGGRTAPPWGRIWHSFGGASRVTVAMAVAARPRPRNAGIVSKTIERPGRRSSRGPVPGLSGCSGFHPVGQPAVAVRRSEEPGLGQNPDGAPMWVSWQAAELRQVLGTRSGATGSTRSRTIAVGVAAAHVAGAVGGGPHLRRALFLATPFPPRRAPARRVFVRYARKFRGRKAVRLLQLMEDRVGRDGELPDGPPTLLPHRRRVICCGCLRTWRARFGMPGSWRRCA